MAARSSLAGASRQPNTTGCPKNHRVRRQLDQHTAARYLSRSPSIANESQPSSSRFQSVRSPKVGAQWRMPVSAWGRHGRSPLACRQAGRAGLLRIVDRVRETLRSHLLVRQRFHAARHFATGRSSGIRFCRRRRRVSTCRPRPVFAFPAVGCKPRLEPVARCAPPSRRHRAMPSSVGSSTGPLPVVRRHCKSRLAWQARIHGGLGCAEEADVSCFADAQVLSIFESAEGGGQNACEPT